MCDHGGCDLPEIVDGGEVLDTYVLVDDAEKCFVDSVKEVCRGQGNGVYFYIRDGDFILFVFGGGVAHVMGGIFA